MVPKQVFISYSTEDSASAAQIRDGLESSGISCWMAPRDIAPGLDYAEQIIDAIESCTVLLLVLSESANRSQYVRNEVERAVAKRKVVIPVRIQEVQPSRSLEFFISNAQWIDAWQILLEGQAQLLVAAIRTHIHPSPASSPATALPTPPITFAAAPSPTHVPANRHSNLPTPSTPFVGREIELVEIARQLADADCRLLTLAGHGGIGETRLSLEVAHRILAEGTLAPNGVFFVALDSLTTPQQIPSAIASALGMSLSAQGDTMDLLLTFLAEKQLLLVLDNFEHLLDGAELVAEMLSAAPGVKVLATSREALNVQEEWFHPIGGLDLPAEGASKKEALASSAIQLLALSARRARKGFEVEAELDQVVKLSRLVDGTPLALELAAAWLRSLTCAQIVQELQNRLELLASTMRNAPQRHRSMEAVFSQSWQLLEERERNVLCQLAVFQGGFDLAAAKAVSGVSPAMLTRLVESSWLRVGEEDRYEIVPLVRNYLLNRLKADYVRTAGEEPDQVRDRHSHYYASLLRQMTAGQREQEVANLRAAWRHALAHFDSEAFHRFVTRMLFNLLLRKGWADSYQEAEELLVASEQRLRTAMTGKEVASLADEMNRTLATLMFQRAVASNRAGLSQKAETLCREGLAILDQLRGDEDRNSLRVQALEILSWILISQSRLREADETSQQALAEHTDLEDWEYQAYALHYLAYSVEEQGRFAESKAHLHRALELLPAGRPTDFIDFIVISRLGSVSYMMGAYEQAAEWWGRAAEIQHVAPRLQRLEHQIYWARLEIVTGNLESARTRCLTVLPQAREHNIRLCQIYALSELGRIALLLGAADEAESYYREAKQVAEQIGRRKEIAKAMVGLGDVELARAAFPAAAAYFRQALAISWPLGFLPEAIAAIIGLAQVAAQAGQREQAASWLRMAVENAATPHHLRLHAQTLLAAVDTGESITGDLEEIVVAALASTSNDSGMRQASPFHAK